MADFVDMHFHIFGKLLMHCQQCSRYRKLAVVDKCVCYQTSIVVNQWGIKEQLPFKVLFTCKMLALKFPFLL